MPFQRLITDDNIDRFIDLLERADTGGNRAVLQRLLVAEEDRYAQREHQRDALHRCLSTCSAKIERQAKLMDDMRANGHDLNQAEAFMNNLVIIYGTLTSFKSTLWSD